MISFKDLEREILKLKGEVKSIQNILRQMTTSKERIKVIKYKLDTSTGTANISTISTGEILEEITVKIETAFDGSAPTLRIYDGSEDLILTWETNLKETFLYAKKINKLYAAGNIFTLVLNQSNSTAGLGYVYLTIVNPK
uniref:Uncharacterized protein n=1 Tax=viral metagenome TaxID=1070528 RepID=A0A6M3XNS2_9ZZZZ